jgi:aminoglycoside/choline kinase family phosphotransferase
MTCGVEDLAQVLAARIGSTRRICRVERRPSPYRSSFFIDEIDVTLDDGTAIGLIAKPADSDALSPEAKRARPLFLRDDARECLAYESILAHMELNTPQFFGSYVDSAGIQFLLIERIDGVPLWQCSEFDAWREAARWLARLHAGAGVRLAESSGTAGHLIRYDREYYDQWMRRACEFHEASHRDLEWLARRHSSVTSWLLAESTAFIHGEFYPANVLVSGSDGQGPLLVRPIDWETAALGPALVDLACLLAGGWTDEERADVADAYFAERAGAGEAIPPRTHYLKTLDCGLIHLSVRNLGWSRDWSPPPDRSHDWLHEALRLCNKWQM